jgi:predicted nucleic acid-binding protein
MTDKLLFDTDCISAFLWVKEENILFKLYPGKIILPKPVFNELTNPSIPHIKRKVKELCLNGDVTTKEILVNTEEYKLYYELAILPSKGEKIIGKGEAAAIALAKTYNGIIASNNLKDISKYIKKYQLEHITTGGILVAALNEGYIDEQTGNQIWTNMISRRRMLPTPTLTEYLKTIK